MCIDAGDLQTLSSRLPSSFLDNVNILSEGPTLVPVRAGQESVMCADACVNWFPEVIMTTLGWFVFSEHWDFCAAVNVVSKISA